MLAFFMCYGTAQIYVAKQGLGLGGLVIFVSWLFGVLKQFLQLHPHPHI